MTDPRDDDFTFDTDTRPATETPEDPGDEAPEDPEEDSSEGDAV